MKEASRRRDGTDKSKAEKPKADKSAKADKPKVEKPKVEKPKVEKPKEEKAIADVFADLGMCIKVIDEKKYLVCDDGEAFNLTEDGNMGERAGRYDADTDTIDETE
jgi:membrane protein involved in colicin uptake